jgi:hypothetical protein
MIEHDPIVSGRGLRRSRSGRKRRETHSFQPASSMAMARCRAGRSWQRFR